MFSSAASAGRAVASSWATTNGTSPRIIWPILKRRIYRKSLRSSQTGGARAGVKTMASVPVVDVAQYEAQLLAKVETVKQLFSDYKGLPEFEVPSPPFRMRSQTFDITAGMSVLCFFCEKHKCTLHAIRSLLLYSG